MHRIAAQTLSLWHVRYTRCDAGETSLITRQRCSGGIANKYSSIIAYIILQYYQSAVSAALVRAACTQRPPQSKSRHQTTNTTATPTDQPLPPWHLVTKTQCTYQGFPCTPTAPVHDRQRDGQHDSAELAHKARPLPAQHPHNISHIATVHSNQAHSSGLRQRKAANTRGWPTQMCIDCGQMCIMTVSAISRHLLCRRRCWRLYLLHCTR